MRFQIAIYSPLTRLPLLRFQISIYKDLAVQLPDKLNIYTPLYTSLYTPLYTPLCTPLCTPLYTPLCTPLYTPLTRACTLCFQIAIYKDRLAVQLPDKLNIYELPSDEAQEMAYRPREKLTLSVRADSNRGEGLLP